MKTPSTTGKKPVPTESSSMAQILSQHTKQLNAEKKEEDIRQAKNFQMEKDTIIR